MKEQPHPWHSLRPVQIGWALGLIASIGMAQAQQAIDTITTQWEQGPGSSYTAPVQPDANASNVGSGTATLIFNDDGTSGGGSDHNLMLITFGVGVLTYEVNDFLPRVEFRRNPAVPGVGAERQLIWLQTTTGQANQADRTFRINPDQSNSMEDALLGPIINRGTDNVFDNVSSNNKNNIQRIDYIYDAGLNVVQPSFLDFGFGVMERGGNDPFGIATITSLDNSGLPSGYGPLRTLSSTSWGPNLVQLDTLVVRRDDGAPELGPSALVTGQHLRGIFFSLDDLGVSLGDTIYGYSLFGGDIGLTSNLVDWMTFPTNTSAANGGMDLVSGGIAFTIQGQDTDGFFGTPASVIPEPSTWLAGLTGLGVLAWGKARYRRKKRSEASRS